MRTIIIHNSRHYALAALAVISLAQAPAMAGEQHDYTVTVDKNLSLLSVEARFSAPVRRVGARSDYARQFLKSARDCRADEDLKLRGRTLRLPAAGIRCLAYTVDLKRAAQSERLAVLLDAANVTASPTVWMWQPRLADGDEIRVHFKLPDNIRVSVPWPSIPNTENAFRLTASPQSGDAIVVFGDFAQRVVEVPGAQLDVTLLRTPTDIDATEVADWIQSTAENVALAYGRFPNPDARIVVIPTGRNPWGGDSPVPFGRVVRDGGETIELMVNERRPVSDYYAEWTPTHEFSHLMLPYLARSQRWISEGFASYYQNVLLARAGQYTEQQAWQKLYAGFERGRDSVPALSPNDAAGGGERNTRMKVYWSGAVLALMADVELRRRSGGRESLDTVLGRLQRCCLPSGRTWSGPELFTQLDALLAEPLFMDLYGRYADKTGFPDAHPLLRELGVISRFGSFEFNDGAELALIRDAIMAPE